MPFNFEALADILVCPQSHARLVQDGDRLVSTDRATRLAFAIRDNIPILLIDEATALDIEEWEGIMRAQGVDAGTGSQSSSEN